VHLIVISLFPIISTKSNSFDNMVTTREQSKPAEIPRRQSGRERKPVSMFSLEEPRYEEKIITAQVRDFIEVDPSRPCLKVF
jgi:hypothetical protein